MKRLRDALFGDFEPGEQSDDWKRGRKRQGGQKIESDYFLLVEVDRSSYSTKRKFTLKNSSVKGSGERGMYIFKRKIEVRGCEVQENGGEGIDLHPDWEERFPEMLSETTMSQELKW